MLKGATPDLGCPRCSAPPREMRIIGVDPGLGATGFGLIAMCREGKIIYHGSGVIRASSAFSFSQRIQHIYRRLSEEIRNYTPHLMAVEQPFFAKNVKSAMLL